MQKQIFPIIGDEKELPFYIVGIGVECWQYSVNRTGGYDYPQILVTQEGEGEITVNGSTVKLPVNSVFFIPSHLPHEYHSLSDSWIISWVCFSGYGAEPILDKWGDKLGNGDVPHFCKSSRAAHGSRLILPGQFQKWQPYR